MDLENLINFILETKIQYYIRMQVIVNNLKDIPFLKYHSGDNYHIDSKFILSFGMADGMGLTHTNEKFSTAAYLEIISDSKKGINTDNASGKDEKINNIIHLY